MAFPEGVRLRALIGDQARCRHCGVSQHDARMEVHHIVPEVRGGNDRLTNAVTLCIDCHYETHGHMWTEQTPISETDIDPEVVEEALNDSRTVIEEYNDKIAELKSQNSTLEALYGIEADRREQLETRRTDLHEKNTALTEDVKRLRKLPRGQAPRLSRGLPFYAYVVAGGLYSPLTFSVPRFKRTSTGAPPSPALCRRRRYCKPTFFAAL